MDMFLNKQQKRYITLDGEPVTTPRPLAILYRNDLRAGLLAASFNAAVAFSGAGDPRIAFGLTIAGAGLNMLLARRGKETILSQAFGWDHKTLAIDKMPDRQTPPTSAQGLYGSQRIVQTTGFYAKIYIAAAALLTPAMINNFQTLAASGMPSMGPLFYVLMGSFVAQLADTLSVTNRFNKVAGTAWNIVEMPKPLEKKQEEKTLVTVPRLA